MKEQQRLQASPSSASEETTTDELEKEENGLLVREIQERPYGNGGAAAHALSSRRALFFFFTGFFCNMTLSVIVVWWIFIDHSAHDDGNGARSIPSSQRGRPTRQPLATPLFLNNTAAYRALWESSPTGGDYFLLQRGFDTQINQAYCGVASAATVLNSFRNHDGVALPVDYEYDPYPYATQEDVFDSSCVSDNVVYRDEDFDGILAAPFGLGMAQVRALLQCFFNDADAWRVQATPVDPSRLTLEQVREELVRLILNSTDARVLVNFDRHVVHEEGGGHWSPVASYSPALDAFLVLDASKYKYPATWVPASLLYRAMGTTDDCGTWDFPASQQDLSDELLYPETSAHYQQALQQLGCRAAWRGFVSVQRK